MTWSGSTRRRRRMPSMFSTGPEVADSGAATRSRSCPWTSANPAPDPQLTCAMATSSSPRASHRRGDRRESPSIGALDLSSRWRRSEWCLTLDIHVVLDNLSAHRAPAGHRWLLRHPLRSVSFHTDVRVLVNLVERFFQSPTEKALKRGSHQPCAAARGDPGVRRGAQSTGASFTWAGKDREPDPRQHAAIRASRSAGPRPITADLPTKSMYSGD